MKIPIIGRAVSLITVSDIVDAQTRSRMMSGIRSKNTKPELIIRQGLHRLGFRFRLHSTQLPGKPDLILPRYRVAIFVNGCFWHGHGCHLFRYPSTRKDFWQTKIQQNAKRDQEVSTNLLKAGWRQLVVWECALRGRKKLNLDELLKHAEIWIKGSDKFLEIAGSE